jgi:hypothetical protein
LGERLALGGLTIGEDAGGAGGKLPAGVGEGKAPGAAVRSRVPSRRSRRVMALDTVGLESSSSLAAALKERSSAILAKIAKASRSGSLLIWKR